MSRQDNNAPLLLDVSRLIWRRWEGVRPTGIDRICDAWLKHFAARSQAVIIAKRRQTILPEGASQALFAILTAPGPGGDQPRSFRPALIRWALQWGGHWLRNLNGKNRFWLNPGHTGLNNPRLIEWCARAKVRPVYLVHDLIPITHPKFCRPGEDARHRDRIHAVLATAAGIVTNSQHSLESLAAFADSSGATLPPMAVAWPGNDQLARSIYVSQANSPASFVTVGTIEGRKNHALLLRVWKRMLNEMGDACPQLLIVGRRGWEAEDVFAELDSYDFRGKVVEAGALDDEQLAEVLGHARALLFPSHVEGFGLPLVEALAAGIPVIASDLAVFREIAGEIPELLPVNDEDAWSAALIDYARDDSTRRERQLSRMAGYSAPTWPEHFARIEAFLGELVSAKSRGFAASRPAGDPF